MTTIAFDGKTVAADTQVSVGYSLMPGKTHKYFPLGGGSYLLGAGLMSEIADWAEWIRGGREGKPPRLRDSSLWLLTSTGKRKKVSAILKSSGSSYVHLLDVNPPWAIGSGGEVALGAMGAGATAAEAVKIASRFDAFTNSKVDILE